MNEIRTSEINPLCACVCSSHEGRERVVEALFEALFEESFLRAKVVLREGLERLCADSSGVSHGLAELADAIEMWEPPSESYTEALVRVPSGLRELAGVFGTASTGRCLCSAEDVKVSLEGIGDHAGDVRRVLETAYPDTNIIFE